MERDEKNTRVTQGDASLGDTGKYAQLVIVLEH